MSERAFAPIYEISSENKIAGRRPIKVVLHEIFPDNTRWQENGISWKEEYVQDNLHSVVGMSIVAEFLTEDRDVPYNHGMTDVREEDKLPLFEDATMVGHFDKAYVDDVEIGGVTKRCLVAEGTLDEMRYPKFVAWLRENMADSVVKGSVEIVGKPEHDGYIIYSGGWKEEGRVPQYYDYSGYAILSVKPADEAAIVMELNNKKLDKEDGTMDEKTKNELMAAVTGAVSEVNSKWEEYWAKVDTLLAEISQLKADIAQKEADIKQLQADYDKEAAAKGDALLREYAQTLIEYIEHYLRFEGAQGDMVSGLIDEKLDQLGDIYYLASYADRKEVVAELNDYYRSLGVSEENLIDVGDKRQQPDSALLPAAK